jgi:cell division septation protein DedD
MASLNPFETTAIVEPVTEIIPAVKIEAEATPIVEIIEEEIAPVIIPEKTYYIIAGAFAEQRNANKMIAKLKRWDYNTEIVPGGNLLRVSYDSFTNKADALVALNQIKQENSAAWLLSL